MFNFFKTIISLFTLKKGHRTDLSFWINPIIFLIFVLMMGSAYGEYRVYQYYVKSKISNKNTNAVVILSTLNPVSYLSYHGGDLSISLDLLRTWMCPGHTGHKRDFCRNPYGAAPVPPQKGVI